MLKKALITLLLLSPFLLGINSCAGLPKDFPKDPEVTQLGVQADIEPPGFYGPESYSPFDDPVMKGAQCVVASEAQSIERYKAAVKAFVIERCECK